MMRMDVDIGLDNEMMVTRRHAITRPNHWLLDLSKSQTRHYWRNRG